MFEWCELPLPNKYLDQQNWSAQALLLSDIEGGPIYNAINFNFSAEGADAGPINLTAKEARITSYLCPSDPNIGGDNRNNYFASKGTTTVKSRHDDIRILPAARVLRDPRRN